MVDTITIISGPRQQGYVSLAALHRVFPQIYSVGNVGDFGAKSREEGKKCKSFL